MADVSLGVIFGSILLGVVLSIICPVVVKWAKLDPTKRSSGFRNFMNSIYKPYLLAGIAAIVISCIILLFLPEDVTTWKAAAFLGFGWQSFIATLQT